MSNPTARELTFLLCEVEDQLELANMKIAMLTEALVVAGLHPTLIKNMLDEVTL